MNVDQYLTDTAFQAQVRKALGQKSADEISRRVMYLVAERQKETPSASAS